MVQSSSLVVYVILTYSTTMAWIPLPSMSFFGRTPWRTRLDPTTRCHHEHLTNSSPQQQSLPPWKVPEETCENGCVGEKEGNLFKRRSRDDEGSRSFDLELQKRDFSSMEPLPIEETHLLSDDAEAPENTRENHSPRVHMDKDVVDVEASPAWEETGSITDREEISFVTEAYERGKWLLGLLVLQSTSSFVLDHYQSLLREHLVVTLFLTMLVGAGGNAGNQSAIKVIRGLATGEYSPTAECASRVTSQQTLVAVLLGSGLALGGYIRVAVTSGTTLLDAAAISCSLFLIVLSSVLLGTALPFGLAKAGVDPANAGTTIQVLMDIVGVFVTCATCSLVLDQLGKVLEGG
ncbi:unnamed protein product [Discosporangium mesarthrocarpum]